MDLPVPAEDALAQPTRAQIFTFRRQLPRAYSDFAAAGIFAALDPQTKLIEFEPRDPESAGCVIEVQAG